MRPAVFTSRRSRASVLRWLAAGALALLVLAVLVRTYAPFLADAERLRAWVNSFGPLAPVAFVVLQAVQVIVAPIPGSVTGVLAGWLFGTIAGTVYSLIGVTLGSLVVFALSRRYGRPYVERVVTADFLGTFDGLVRERGTFALFVVFLLPGLPDDALAFVAGLTEIPMWKLVVVAVAGRFPTVLLMAMVGAEAANGKLLDAALIALGLTAVAALAYRNRDLIARWLRREGDRSGA